MSSSDTILVTGSSGFIGSHVLRFFHGKGLQTYGIDRNPPRESTLPKNHIFVADISNIRIAKKILASVKPTVLIHHASNLVDVEASVLHPERAIKDLSITASFIETARLFGLRHIIYASSANVYGSEHTDPISESSRISPLSPYGLTKLAVEQYLEYFSFRYAITCTMLRYFNVYGPGQSLKNNPVIPSFISSSLNNKPITLFGGDQVRDFVYVTDVARANYAAYKKRTGGVFNVAGGKGISMKRLAGMVTKQFSRTSVINILPRSISNCKYSVADVRKIRNTLHWKAEVPLLVGLKETAAYYRARKKSTP